MAAIVIADASPLIALAGINGTALSDLDAREAGSIRLSIEPGQAHPFDGLWHGLEGGLL